MSNFLYMTLAHKSSASVNQQCVASVKRDTGRETLIPMSRHNIPPPAAPPQCRPPLKAQIFLLSIYIYISEFECEIYKRDMGWHRVMGAVQLKKLAGLLLMLALPSICHSPYSEKTAKFVLLTVRVSNNHAWSTYDWSYVTKTLQPYIIQTSRT